MLVNTFEKKPSTSNDAISWIMTRLDYTKISKVIQYADENPELEYKVVLFEYKFPNTEYIRVHGNQATVDILPGGNTVDSMVRGNYEVRDFLDKMFRTPNTNWYVRFNHRDGTLEASSCQVVLHFLEKLPPLVSWSSCYSPINSSHC